MEAGRRRVSQYDEVMTYSFSFDLFARFDPTELCRCNRNPARYGEALPDDDPRKESLGTVYRNWHPGPLGFQVAADAFAYVYVTGLLLALDIIEEDMKANVDVLERWFATDRKLESMEEEETENLQTLQLHVPPSKPSMHHRLRSVILPPLGDMPEPLFCDPLYCSTPHPPSCLNYEKPTFGTPGITVQSQGKWQVFNEPHSWTNMVGKKDRAIIKEKHDPEWERKCTHLDACGGIWAMDATQGPLTFELPSSRMTAGLVFICVTPYHMKTAATENLLENRNVTFRLNDRVLDKSKMDPYPMKKCLRLLKAFGEDGFEKEETMLLTLEMAEQDPDLPDELKPRVEVSHIVAL